MITRIELIDKLRFLFEPHDNKVIWGGRDGIKSWTVAQTLLIIAAQGKLRWLCGRETQQSIDESVHQLLEEQIRRLHLDEYFRVERKRIVGTVLQTTGMYGEPLATPGYSEFVFAGLRHNVNQLKSYEAFDGVWVEEAVNVSKDSWEKVIPTLRKEGSEVWVTFNPELTTDETYKRWVLNPPPRTVVVKTSYLDNRWLSETSLRKIQFLYETDPEAAANVYGGECKSAVEGAIFGLEMKAAQAAGRIGMVPYHPAHPVDTIWDLGFGDPCSIWFVQCYDGWFHFIDYFESNHLVIADYMVELQRRKYLYGRYWLPHDGIDTIIHQKLSGSADRSMSILELVRGAVADKKQVDIIRKMLVTDQINAARMIFPLCRFDEKKCADGIQALRHYQWPPPNQNIAPNRRVAQTKPLHNWASHASSAFMGAAVALRQPKAPTPDRERQRVPASPWS